MSKRKMLKMVLDEISAVDSPAQEGAMVRLFKAAKKPADAEDAEDEADNSDDEAAEGEAGGEEQEPAKGKKAKKALDAEVEEYLKRDFSAEQRNSDAKSGAAMPGGGFPIENRKDLENAMRALGRAKDRAATIKHIKARAKALGLTDMLSDVYKNEPAGESGNEPNETTMTPQEVEALQKRAERAEQLASLNDAQRAVHSELQGSDADAFLAKTPAERQAVVAKRADSNPVIETVDGQEFRKNDDPRLLKMAKALKEQREETAEAKKVSKAQRLQKRAGEELAHLPGKDEHKVALLDVVESMPAEQRTEVEKMLKAADAGMAAAFARKGATGTPDQIQGEEKIEAIAKSIREKLPNLTPEQAYAKALQTPEGKEAYKSSRPAR